MRMLICPAVGALLVHCLCVGTPADASAQFVNLSVYRDRFRRGCPAVGAFLTHYLCVGTLASPRQLPIYALTLRSERTDFTSSLPVVLYSTYW